jgi:YcxB-like protein
VSITASRSQTVVFTASAAELAAARKLAAIRLSRTLQSWDYLAVTYLSILVIALAVYAAYEFGLFDRWSLRPVLVTAYVAFIVGVCAEKFLRRWQVRRITRAFYAGEDKVEWQVSFDDTGMLWRSETMESRVSWRAIRGIEDTGAMLLLWRDIPSRSTFIPTRAFESAEARAAFVAAVTTHIASA